jgi:hypothetical protein
MTATNDPGPVPPPAEDDEYSATVLGSQWIQRPDPDTTLVEPPAADDPRTLVEPRDPDVPSTLLAPREPEGPSTLLAPPDPEEPTTPVGKRASDGPATPVTAPDRVEGSVLRFGPGVTAALTHRSHLTLPAVQPAPSRPRRNRRRHAVPVLVLIVVAAFLAWQRSGPELTLREVSVSTRQAALECDGTADVVGVITTDGRPGTVSYRWVRSDGTTSGVLREVMARGQKQARVHLLWTFEGEGTYQARAKLRILSPASRTATARFTYDCS